MRGLQIDYETADRITLICLQDQLAYVREDVRKHLEEGSWMHPEDLQMNQTSLIPALETLVKYWGGEV